MDPIPGPQYTVPSELECVPFVLLHVTFLPVRQKLRLNFGMILGFGSGQNGPQYTAPLELECVPSDSLHATFLNLKS